MSTFQPGLELFAAEGSVTIVAAFTFAAGAILVVYGWLVLEMKRAHIAWPWFLGLAVASVATYGLFGVLVSIWWVARSRGNRSVLRSGLLAFGVALLLAGCAGLAGWVHNADQASADFEERGELNTSHDEQAGWGKVAAGAGSLLGVALIAAGASIKADGRTPQAALAQSDPRPVDNPRHCGQCGAGWSTGSRFCTTCGEASA